MVSPKSVFSLNESSMQLRGFFSGHLHESVLNLAMAEFDLDQKRQLFEQGWVVIPQVVPAEMVRAARATINATVESYLDSIQVRAHELKTDVRLTSMLMKTDAFSLIESALGKGKVIPSTNV